MARLVAVAGASPGIGKTTLAERLAAEGRQRGRVDLFLEEGNLWRREFSTVATQCRDTGVVDPDVLLDASARFVASAATYDIVVTDSLFPFAPSFAGMGPR